MAGRQGGDDRGVEPAAEEGTHRDVGHEVSTHRVLDDIGQSVGGQLIGRVDELDRVPVAVNLQPSSGRDLGPMPRREFLQASVGAVLLGSQ